MKKYEFESANAGTITVEIIGESDDGKDIHVSFVNDGVVFDEIDAGDAEIVMLWMLGHGIEFESPQAFMFNYRYIQIVMLDEDGTQQDVMHLIDDQLDQCPEQMRDMIDDNLLTIAEAAKVAGVSRQRIQQLIDDGTLDYMMPGNRAKYVKVPGLLAWSNSDRKPGPKPKAEPQD